jgi:hypothetical protein
MSGKDNDLEIDVFEILIIVSSVEFLGRIVGSPIIYLDAE